MKKLTLAILVAYACLLTAVSAGGLFNRAGTVVAAFVPIPTMVAGTATPQSEDNSHPSMSRWDPSCLDATWGVGCNTLTHTCIAPSPGTPDEPCQPPLQLYPISGTGNGTTATITYHSETNYVFPVGTPLNVLGSTSWDTPTAGVTNMVRTSNGSACASPTDQCLSFTLAPTTGIGPVTPGPVKFIPTTPVYVGGVTGNLSSLGGLENFQFGWGQPVASGSYNNTTGVTSITLANPYFGSNPTTLFQLRGLGFSGGTCTSPCQIGAGFYTPTSVSGAGTVLNFTDAPGLATANLTITAGNIFGTGQGGPNHIWTPDGTWTAGTGISTLNVDIQSVFPYSFTGSLVASNNFGVNGNITQPWPVTASSCSLKTCTVSFLHNVACASNCVTTNTTIVAGQKNGPIIGWMTGPIAPFAVENGTLLKCVSAHHISGGATDQIVEVKMAIDGGPLVSAKYMLDPWGVGAAANPADPLEASVINNVHVWCAQIDASTLSDGLHEIRAWARSIAGPISQLTSAITAEAKTGDPNLVSNMHYMQDVYHLGITQTQDTAFAKFNNAYQTQTTTSVSTLPISNAVLAAGNVTYTYAPGTTILPIPAGFPVAIAGVLTNNSCAVTGGTATGNTITYTYTGGCSFPVGSHIDIAGIGNTVATTQALSSVAYNSGTGDLTVTMAAAKWGATPGFNGITQFAIAGTTGTGAASVNGNGKILVSSASAGTVLHFTIAKSLTIAITPGTGTIAGSASTGGANIYSWNGSDVVVTATNGSSTVSVTGMSLGNYGGGGTITEAWDGHCIPSSSTLTTIVCAAPPNSAAATWVSGGTIQANAGTYCVVGGPGDNPIPFDPSFTFGMSMTANTFQILPRLADTCNDTAVNNTGCRSFTCGVLPTTNSTLWFNRHDAGAAEMRGSNNFTGQVTGTPNDGSFWVYTNFNGTMKAQSVYVDQWDPASAVAFTCNGPPSTVLPWNSPGPTYAGVYCANEAFALKSMLVSTAFQQTATVGFSGGCTTFSSATFNSSKVVAGEPIIWIGTDKGNAGDGSDAQLSTWGLYFVKSNTAGTMTLSPKGDLSTCITEPSANITRSLVQQDLGFANVYYRCNHSVGCNPPSNPETVFVGGQGGAGLVAGAITAKSGWMNFAPDQGNGTGQHDVNLLFGPSVNIAFPFPGVTSQTGRVRSSLDRTWHDLTLTPVVAVGPTPPPSVTVTGGSLSGTCPGAGCTETVNFTALANNFAGAKYQAPTSAAPGQQIVVQGITGNTSYNCGTGAVPCIVTASSTTSVSFLNATASGAYGAAGTIVPVSFAMEFANGTFPNLAGTGSDCTTSSTTLYQAITPPLGAVACTMNGSGFTATYGLSPLFGVYADIPVPYTVNTVPIKSNCTIIPSGGTGTFPSTVQQVLVAAGKNDVIIFGNNSTGQPAWLYNPCPDITLGSTTGPFWGAGANDSWDSEVTVNGPYYWEGSAGGISGKLINSNFGGTSYITNHSSTTANDAFDNSGYVWGSSDIWNVGICHNNGAAVFHMRCIGNGRTAPQALGGVDWRTPGTITHSYATYADYIANTPILCSGHDCITTASRLFKVASMGAGTIPEPVVVNWFGEVICNYYPGGAVTALTTTPIGSGSNNVISWLDKTANVFQVTSAPTSGCDPITSSGAWFDYTFHTDTNFLRTGPNDTAINGTGTAHEFLNRLPWATGNNYIMDQADVRETGESLAIFTEGGSQINVAVVNSWEGGIGPPQPNAMFLSIDTNSYGAVNWLNLNNVINQPSTPQYMYNANGNPSYIARAPYDDTYYINTVPWNPFGATPQSPGFPIVQGEDVTYVGGFRTLSDNVADITIEIPVGHPLPDVGLWPSEASMVDVAGNPTLNSGTPYYPNLKTCPWFCVAADPMNSLQ